MTLTYTPPEQSPEGFDSKRYRDFLASFQKFQASPVESRTPEIAKKVLDLLSVAVVRETDDKDNFTALPNSVNLLLNLTRSSIEGLVDQRKGTEAPHEWQVSSRDVGSIDFGIKMFPLKVDGVETGISFLSASMYMMENIPPGKEKPASGLLVLHLKPFSNNGDAGNPILVYLRENPVCVSLVAKPNKQQKHVLGEVLKHQGSKRGDLGSVILGIYEPYQKGQLPNIIAASRSGLSGIKSYIDAIAAHIPKNTLTAYSKWAGKKGK